MDGHEPEQRADGSERDIPGSPLYQETVVRVVGDRPQLAGVSVWAGREHGPTHAPYRMGTSRLTCPAAHTSSDTKSMTDIGHLQDRSGWP